MLPRIEGGALRPRAVWSKIFSHLGDLSGEKEIVYDNWLSRFGKTPLIPGSVDGPDKAIVFLDINSENIALFGHNRHGVVR